MTGETVFIFSMAVILMHIKPGPGQALRITTVLKDGFLSALAISIGVCFICNIYLVLAATSANIISEFFQNTGIFFRVMAALYLMYLGIKGFRKNKNSKPESNRVINQKSFLQYFLLGCVLSLSNPIDIFFFMGILPGLIELGTLTAQNIFAFMLIMTVITLALDILILGLVSLSKTSLIEGKYARYIGAIANIGLILIGIYLIYTAISEGSYSFEII